MHEPLISVVILTWNRKEDLLPALDSVFNQTYKNFEVVLIDSACTDGTHEAVTGKYPEVVYIKLPYNLGVSGGRNLGAANAKGELILFLDDDAAFLAQDAFEQIVHRFQFEEGLALMFFQYQLKDGSLWGTVFPYKIDTRFLEMESYTFTFVGCSYCMRREIIEDIGYLRPEFFREGEEKEFSYRIIGAGGKILYFPEVKIVHLLNPNQRIMWENQAKKVAHFIESEMLHLSLADAISIVLWRIGYYLISALKDRWLFGYFKGFALLVTALPRIIRDRKPFSRDMMNFIRVLNCFIVLDHDAATAIKVSLLDWIRVRITRKPLGIIDASGRRPIDRLEMN